MIKIERNEKWKYPQIKINNKTMCEFDKKTGQWVYDKHIIVLKSGINIKDVKYEKDGKDKSFKSCYFLGTLDNSQETYSFSCGEMEYKQLKECKIDDIIQIEGGFYLTKNEEFKTKVIIKKVG